MLGLVLGLTLGPSACADDLVDASEVVARVSGEGQTLELDRRVVELLMRRDALSEAEAEARARETLRLVAARRAALAAREQPPTQPDDLDPARREHLERAALVRLWLDEVFEPGTAAATIPQRVVSQNLADPSMTRRLFHPQLYFVCQALVVPAAKDDDGRHVQPPSEPEAAQRWRAAAEQAFAPFVARVGRIEPDLVTNGDCSLLGNIVGTSERSFEPPPDASPELGAVTLRYERFAFAPSEADSFDPAWVEAVTARTEPGLIEPFATRFGLHLVVVGKIEPARLEHGSLPEAELQAARELVMREELEQPWRIERLQQTLVELRDRHIVRLAPELEQEG